MERLAFTLKRLQIPIASALVPASDFTRGPATSKAHIRKALACGGTLPVSLPVPRPASPPSSAITASGITACLPYRRMLKMPRRWQTAAGRARGSSTTAGAPRSGNLARALRRAQQRQQLRSGLRPEAVQCLHRYRGLDVRAGPAIRCGRQRAFRLIGTDHVAGHRLESAALNGRRSSRLRTRPRLETRAYP